MKFQEKILYKIYPKKNKTRISFWGGYRSDILFIYSVVPRLERGSQRSIGSTAGRKTNDTDGTLLITNGTNGGVDSSANQETRTSRTSRASRASSESIRNISTSVYTTEVENVFKMNTNV